MELVNQTGTWEAITKYGETTAPKDCGFRWNPERKRWYAPALTAIQLIDYASEADQAKLKDQVQKIKAADAAKIAASRATDSNIDIPAPEGLSYLPYQKAGIAYAASRKDTLIADEMGLGKTIQALGAINLLLSERPEASFAQVLIVAPKIALRNWAREAEKWLIRSHQIAIWTAKDQPAADIVILNYDVLAKVQVANAVRMIAWDFAVFDECHALKNGKAARTKQVFGAYKEGILPIKANKRVFLTGTPILNRPIELFPILNSIGVPEARDFYSFAEKFCNGHHSGYGYVATGASNLDELQEVLRKSVMIRRLKADVLKELPSKRYSVIELDAETAELKKALKDEQSAQAKMAIADKKLVANLELARKSGSKAAMDAAVAALASGRRTAFTEMSKLRHKTAVAKVPQVIEHVVDVFQGSEESILVFAHHGDVIAGLKAGIEAAGYQCAVITGDTSDVARQAAQDDVQAKRKRVFIGSMRACGVAITLTAASTVIFAEQDWTPGIMVQAEDRAHRIGQENSVLVQHLVVNGSIDADMAKKVAAKSSVIDEALDAIVQEPAVEVVAAADAVVVEEPIEIAGDVESTELADVASQDDVMAMDAALPVEITDQQPKRRPGRPSLGDAPLTKAERNKRWRQSKEIVALEIPAGIAERLRKLREQRGLTNLDLLTLALDALDESRVNYGRHGSEGDALVQKETAHS